MLVAVVFSIVVGEIDLAIAGRSELGAEFTLHGQAIIRPKLSGKALVEVSTVRSAHAAQQLGRGGEGRVKQNGENLVEGCTYYQALRK